MDDKIVFEDNKQSNNDELLKENTPETIDYNKLYNINNNVNTNVANANYINNNQPINNQIINNNTNSENNIINNDITNQNINENNESLVGLEETSNNIETKNDFLQAKKFDKPVANFIKKDDVNVSELSQEELKNYQSIQSITDDNVSIYHDENGNMTNIVKDDYNNYSTITEINGEQQMINHDTNNKITKKTKQKVLSKNTPKAPNISAAFTNTLILSFIIGSFFGVIFLAIYLKIMH